MSTASNNNNDDHGASVVVRPPLSAFAIVDIENDIEDDDNRNRNRSTNDHNNDAVDHRITNDANDGATIIDDGLSVYDDDDMAINRGTMTSTDAIRIQRDARKYRILSTCGLFVTLVISVLVASSSYYVRWDGVPYSEMQEQMSGDDEDGDDETMMPGGTSNGLDETMNERRLRRILDYLIATDASSSSTLQHPMGGTSYSITMAIIEGGSDGAMSFMMDTTISPQYRAAVWLAMFDNMRLDVPWDDPNDMDDGESMEDGGDIGDGSATTSEYEFLQRYALAVLYLSSGGLSSPTGWTFDMHFLREWHECQWNDSFMIDSNYDGGMDGIVGYGVECDGMPDYDYDGDVDEMSMDEDRVVTGIYIPPHNNLVGTLPPELRHLRYLKVLRIGNNEGVGGGEIPFQYGTLKNLRELSLTTFGLGGTIPRSLSYMKKLLFLDLSWNMLVVNTTDGDLDFLAEMPSLEVLFLEYNKGITGTLPDAISDATSLFGLSVSNTGLHGTLPPSLSRLTNLRALYLDDCNFTGGLDVIMDMTNLTHVFLEDNSFTGIIDDDFFANTTNLTYLDVSNCSLGGFVPGHLFNMTALEVLDMSDNEIGGILPGGAMNLSDGGALKFLSLHTNNITGSIPSSIGNLRGLMTLDLSRNRLTGSMPSEIGDLLDLDALFLGNNNYTNALFPAWVENLTSLSELMLKGSSITGNIPPFLGNLERMRFLDLGVNELTGTIPQELNNLGDLVVLILNSNMLDGQLGLGELSKLETLLIDDNRLTGDTSAICEHEIEYFVSDCSKGTMDVSEIVCDCCTLCCRDADVTCNDADWLASPEGMWEFGYNRIVWNFGNGSISPYVDHDDLT